MRGADGPYPYGSQRLYVNAADQVIAAYVRDGKLWAAFETETLLTALRPGDGVVDVGANIGTHTVRFAAAVGPRGHVLAFEPDSANRRTLRRNLRLNGLRNVRVRREALSDHEGRATIHLSAANTGAHSLVAGNVADPGGRQRIRLTTLDRATRRSRAPLRLVKMDIQGLEAAALRGAQAVLARHRPIVSAEFVPSMLQAAGEDPLTFPRQLAAMGYRLHLLNDVDRTVRPIRLEELATVPESYDNTLVMVPEEDPWRP